MNPTCFFKLNLIVNWLCRGTFMTPKCLSWCLDYFKLKITKDPKKTPGSSSDCLTNCRKEWKCQFLEQSPHYSFGQSCGLVWRGSPAGPGDLSSLCPTVSAWPMKHLFMKTLAFPSPCKLPPAPLKSQISGINIPCSRLLSMAVVEMSF